MPKISVIIPVYNTEKYLNTCLDSIINQTYNDIEIIIINDGSTDKSEIIINEYLEKYPMKIKYIKKENGGLSSARNCGVQFATGDYISFIDSDDYIDTNLFFNLKQEIDLQTDLIKFKLIKTYSYNKESEKCDGPTFNCLNGQAAFNSLVFKDKLLEPACIYLYKRETFLKNNYKFKDNLYHEDFGLIPLIMVNSCTVSSLNIYGYFYLQTNNSITRNSEYKNICKSAADLLLHYDNMIETIKTYNLSHTTINNLKLYYSNAIFSILSKLNYDTKKDYLLEIKKRRLLKNIKVKNIKQLIKRIFMTIKINIMI